MMMGNMMQNMSKMSMNMGNVMGGLMHNPFSFEIYDQQNELEASYGKRFNVDIASFIPLLVII